MTIIFFINKFLSSVLHGKTPYQALFRKPSYYSFLRTSKFLCYASTFSHNRDKFIARATPCVLIGCSHNKNGYILLELSTKRILFSKDVKFHEFVFSFSSVTSLVSIFIPSSPSYLVLDTPTPTVVSHTSTTFTVPSPHHSPTLSPDPLPYSHIDLPPPMPSPV